MAAEELVQRVLARHVERQPAAAPPGAAPHLPQRGDRARERHADRRVQRADVDPQLQRVGGDHAEQLAGHQPRLQLAPLLRRVAGPVGRDPLGEVVPSPVLEIELREARHQLDRLARLHEDDRPRLLADQVGQQVGRLGEHRAPRGDLLVDDRRVPHRDRALGGGRAVAVDDRHVLEPGQPLRELARVGDRRRRQQDPRRRAVGVADPPQAPQHVRDVRAEHAAVDVRLVDHHHREVREEVGPRGVVGEDPQVQHVGVGEDDVRPPPDRRALLARRVAVVDRRLGALDAERVQRPRLVLRQRLGRVQVQRPRPRVAAQDVERRQVEAQRLAGGRAGGDDRRARPAGVQRLGLVGPQPVDAALAQRVGHLRVQLLGDRRLQRRPGVLRGLHDQALVVAPRLEELVPGLDVSDDGHTSMLRRSRELASARKPHTGTPPCVASTWISTAPCSVRTLPCCTTATATSRCSASARWRRATGPASR